MAKISQSAFLWLTQKLFSWNKFTCYILSFKCFLLFAKNFRGHILHIPTYINKLVRSYWQGVSGKTIRQRVFSCQQSPRYYVVRDSPDSRSAEQQYSYSYSSASERNSNDPYSYRPNTRSYESSESVRRSTGGGPGSYSYSTERSSRTRGDGPGGYSSSYSSTTSGRLPGGTSYRHYSYRV